MGPEVDCPLPAYGEVVVVDVVVVVVDIDVSVEAAGGGAVVALELDDEDVEFMCNMLCTLWQPPSGASMRAKAPA